jgi:uncharacterized membrane protein YbhN (UPF0104 family)
MAGVTAYVIGHNLGATVLTGGAIRLRIYSAWGLGLADVAKLAFITGLTFWLGNVFVLGLGLAYAPEASSAIDRLPPALNRAIGLGGLAAIAIYLFWLYPRARVIGRAAWRIALPSLPLTALQIGIGTLDLCLGALAMYALLPPAPATDVVTATVVFVSATLLGFLSHAPGSLGVVEAAMLVGLPRFDKAELLAALLIFRMLYFVLPFVVAALLLAARELWMAARAQRP